ncbi:exit protein of rhodopsin and TRP A [Musca autumnalis]|uniref:exit protein of rhodopsin and TRP A n=1 Tax=Musca autumnalis TaxID=221902 RepID=UPI003CEAE482
MKTPKGGAFANSATGYGRKPNSSYPSQKHSLKSSKEEVKLNTVKKDNKKDDKPKCEHHKNVDDDGNELNSGFGAYLRSGEGVEMMKLFVFANTIMLILTMAWPQFKQQYIWLMQWLDTFRED